MSKNDDIGRAWEERLAGILDADLKPGSGNKWWARLDMGDSAALWSAKATRNKSYPVSLDDLAEVIDACEAPGGEDLIPMMGVQLAEGAQEVVVLRIEDFIKIVQEQLKWVPEKKREMKRRRAGQPQLFRDEDEDA